MQTLHKAINMNLRKKQNPKLEPDLPLLLPKKHIKIERDSPPSTKPFVPPSNWKEVYHLIEEFRSTHQAPVDVFGCSACGSYGKTSPQEFRYRILISLMLSSQTKDETTFNAVKNLASHGLTVSNILQTSEEKINELICKVGFHNKKAAYIKRVTQILHDQYNDDIPRSLKEISALPGVGPKMAYLLLQSAWEHSEGIGVDVHVHNISNRLGWAKSVSPEQTRKQLESWLPREYWNKVNKMLVGFGQTVCKRPTPKCEACPVSALCPSSRLGREMRVTPRKRETAATASEDVESREVEAKPRTKQARRRLERGDSSRKGKNTKEPQRGTTPEREVSEE
ncbi:endonuclease III-like protein 1 [Schistocerca gregaria]|uniref:endonuclease III-like protein 1 n=1 Tax=Schistocerca gregaria TaxID=7010 RepID=UPI00211EA5CB|nr:endonuclease III-like protein 1 [Schistocerca gregaria]